MVLARHMTRQEAHGRRAERATLETLDDAGIPPGRPRGRDPVVDRILGEVKLGHAVLEQRGISGALEQPARVELREVDDQGRRGLPLAAGEATQLGGELGVVEA